jgi:hypothetical protein
MCGLREADDALGEPAAVSMMSVEAVRDTEGVDEPAFSRAPSSAMRFFRRGRHDLDAVRSEDDRVLERHSREHVAGSAQDAFRQHVDVGEAEVGVEQLTFRPCMATATAGRRTRSTPTPPLPSPPR